MMSRGWAGLLVLIAMTSALPQPMTSSGGSVVGSSLHRAEVQLEPSEAIVFPGDNVTFVCSSTSPAASFSWEVGSEVEYDVIEGKGGVGRLNIPSASRRMSGEIVCNSGGVKAVAFLIVNGVRNGGPCRVSSDCLTERAACVSGVCDCPGDTVRLRIREKGYDVCRDMIHSLYDPCEYDEQCENLVDPKSVCRSVCVCSPWSRDKRGKCVSASEMSRSRTQEMYRVGLIAVTCIIILIVAVSLWVTLKRSCREPNVAGQRMSVQSRNRQSIVDIGTDKPPSYDDIQVEGNMLETPPTLKDALKHSMTAKRLLRQVSAPAGQLIADIQTLKGIEPATSKSPAGRDEKY